MSEVFGPTGAGITIAVTASPGTGVQATNMTGGNISFRVVQHNISTPVICHLGYGESAAVAQTNAVATADGTHNVLCLLPNSAEAFNLPAGSYFSARTTSGTATIEITPGYGA